MANEVLKSIADDIRNINQSIQEAEELLSAMKEAGEDTSELQADLNNAKMRKERWERMLKARGAL